MASNGQLGKTRDEIDATLGLLGAIPLFGGCTVHDLERLAAAAYPIAFHPGDVLCRAGADSPECYVVSQGEAVVTVGEIEVDRVGAHDIVGERGPITGRPRAATVRAATHMVTYGIPREELQAVISESPAAASTMRDELLRRYG